MKITKVKLAEATLEQLRAAAAAQGIPLQGSENANTIRAKLRATVDGDEITVAMEAPEPAPAGQEIDKAPADPANKWDEMIDIQIDKTEDAGGDQPVWVSVNGRGLWIPRGEICAVKRKYVHVLENAVKTVYHQEKDNGPLIARQVPSYPWRRIERRVA